MVFVRRYFCFLRQGHCDYFPRAPLIGTGRKVGFFVSDHRVSVSHQRVRGLHQRVTVSLLRVSFLMEFSLECRLGRERCSFMVFIAAFFPVLDGWLRSFFGMSLVRGCVFCFFFDRDSVRVLFVSPGDFFSGPMFGACFE